MPEGSISADRDTFVLLVPDARAPLEARHAVTRAVDLPAEQLETVKLLVTELVTNSVCHAGLRADQAIVVSVVRAAGVLRVAVDDEGPGFEHRPAPDGAMSPGGRGLLIVDRMSDRWGIDSGRSTRVWFELDAE